MWCVCVCVPVRVCCECVICVCWLYEKMRKYCYLNTAESATLESKGLFQNLISVYLKENYKIMFYELKFQYKVIFLPLRAVTKFFMCVFSASDVTSRRSYPSALQIVYKG